MGVSRPPLAPLSAKIRNWSNPPPPFVIKIWKEPTPPTLVVRYHILLQSNLSSKRYFLKEIMSIAWTKTKKVSFTRKSSQNFSLSDKIFMILPTLYFHLDIVSKVWICLTPLPPFQKKLKLAISIPPLSEKNLKSAHSPSPPWWLISYVNGP